MPARGQLVNHTISVYPDIEKSERTPLPPQLSEFRIQRSEIRNQKLERTPLPPLTRGLARWRNDTVTGGETNQNKASVTCRSCERREGSLPPSKRHFVPFCHLPRQREERVHLTFDFYRSRDACPCRTVNGRALNSRPYVGFYGFFIFCTDGNSLVNQPPFSRRAWKPATTRADI